MRPLTLRALFLIALAAPLRAGQVEGRIPIEVAPGGQTGVIGGGLSAPMPVQLTVPSLNGSLSAPSLAQAFAPAPGVNPAALKPEVLLAAPAAAPALPESAVVKGAAAANPAHKPAALGGAVKSAASTDDKAQAGGFVDGGRVLFDQAGAPARAVDPVPAAGWGARVKSWLGMADKVPSWPGKAGEKVKLEGKTYTLDKRLADGGGSTIWTTGPIGRDFVVKIIHPEFMSLPHYADEASILRAIKNSDIPHAKLVAANKDGSLMIKEHIEGETAAGIVGRNALSRQHEIGWPEFAARLIKSGVTADLAPGNLIWQHWRSRWVIVDAGGLKDGGPGEVLKQMLTPAFLKAGIDAGAFLSGLRARLGPDSARWAATLAAIKADPALAVHLSALSSYDARLERAPRLAFTAAPKGPAGLDDSVVKPNEVVKRLGYDPFAVKTQIKLHGEDPGKLNTQITAIEEPGKPKRILKIAQWDIIRNEALVRRFARRFFGRYFRVPASVAVNAGWQSYMVMERADATPTYGTGAFNLEQRVAVGIFVHTFGVSDVNPGNVLSPHDKGVPWLIDFEQALSRAAPVAGRIPDERIALEMPWMSRHEFNRVEDYQPGIRAWRAFLAEPATKKAILEDLAAVGFTAAEAAAYLARFESNAADLDWSLQNDADFVNQFVARNAAQR